MKQVTITQDALVMCHEVLTNEWKPCNLDEMCPDCPILTLLSQRKKAVQ